jgi:hypothetical protein
MGLINTIEIDGQPHEAALEIGEWSLGPCVLVSVTKDNEIIVRSKVLCSPESHEFDRVSALSEHDLISEAWSLFKSRYPFDKLAQIRQAGITVLVGWPIET